MGGPFPLSQSQSLVWLGEQLSPNVPVYDSVCTFELFGEIDSSVFVEAFDLLVGRSDSMRMTVDLSAANAVGRVAESGMRRCDFVDLSGRSDRSESWIAKRMEQPIDPQFCMYDSALLKLSDEHYCWYLNAHHLINDGANLEVLFRRQEACYKFVLAKNNGETETELTYPKFYDYVQREQAFRETEAFVQCQKHWQSKVSNPSSSSRLYSRGGKEAGWEHERVYVPLGKGRSDAFRAAAKQPGFRSLTNNMSLFNLFATVMSAWIFRTEGTSEVTFGSTSHSRFTSDDRDTVGLCMQLLPFSIRVEAGETFQSLAKRVSTEQVLFLRNAMPGVTSPELQKTFDVGLNMIPATMDNFCGSPCKPVWRHAGFGDIGRKVSITMQDFGNTGELELLFDFNLSAVSIEARKSTVKHFIATIDQLIADSNQLVSQYELLSSDEREKLTAVLDQSTLDRSSNEETLWSKFEAITVARPTNEAIVDQKQTLTYQQLLDSAVELSKTLEQRSIGCRDIVPLLGGRSASTIIAILAVLKCNATFLLVDSDLPQWRIDDMMADAEASCYINLTGGAIKVVDSSFTTPATDATEDVSSKLEDAAYVLYTSGSTGKPNGVMVSHASVINLLEAANEVAPIRGRVRVSWWTNIGFDVGIYEVFAALLYGHALWIPSDEVRGDPQVLFAWLKDSQIGSIYLPPFFLEEFANWLEANSDWNAQRLLVGVEPILESTLAAINRFIPNLQIVNGYGPTETTVCATFYRVVSESDSNAVTPIGLPIKGNICLIVDQNGKQVPQGVVGELLIGGAGLSLGYLRRPELNAKRFVVDPTGESERIFFRSGDLVRLRFNDQLEFLGRVDQQLKFNGFRIEPEEIANAISQHDAVDQCVVVLVKADNEHPQDRLVAYHSVAGQAKLASAESLRSHVAGILPRHMVPSDYLEIESIPRTANGKVDKTALPYPTRSGTDTDTQDLGAIVQPVTESETKLLGIWKQVLKVDSIGVDHDLFAMGGDSMTAIRIVAAARQVGFSLTPKLIFNNPTVRELAGKAQVAAAAKAIEQVATGAQDLLPVQRWFFNQDHANIDFWNHVLKVSVPQDCDAKNLGLAFRAVVEHHDAFKLNFRKETDWTAEYIDPTPVPIFLDIDLVESSPLELEVQLSGIEQQLHDSLSISKGPLVAAALVATPEFSTLILVAHHLVVDAVSWRVLLEDLEVTYRQVGSGVPCLLPTKTATLQTWAQALARLAESDAFLAQTQYWENATFQPAITWVSKDNEQDEPATVEECQQLTVAETGLLTQKFVQKHRVRVDEICMAALGWAICDWGESSQCQFDIEGHGRESIDDVDVSRTVGWFTTVAPLVLNIDPKCDPLVYLNQVRDQFRAMPVNGLAYGLWKDGWGSDQLNRSVPEHDPSRILFNYLGDVADMLPNDSMFALRESLQLAREENSPSQYWLELNVFVRDGQLTMNWSYRSDRIAPTEAEEFADSFLGYLRRLIACFDQAALSPVSANDFPEADLDAAGLDKLSAVLGTLGNGGMP